MEFRGERSVRTKIITANEPVEEVTQYRPIYLGYNVGYTYGKDIDIKLRKFITMC